MTLGALFLVSLFGPTNGGPCPPMAPVPWLHSVANISDPLSHGVLGDGLLSLNEAILLHNRQLLTSQLSPGELAQLSGFGTDISWINIDATWTPTITVERDFDVILDFPHGILIQGFNGSAVIDFTGPNVQNGFRSISNYCSWRNVELVGGPFGIDLQQTDASFGGTVLDNVGFDGQSQYAFSTAGTTANGYGRVLFDHCRFANTPIAIRCNESPPGRTTILAAFDTAIAASADGIDIVIGPGGSGIFQFDKVGIDVPGTGLALRRNAGADRPATFSATHLRIAGSTCLDLQGEPFGTTSLTLRMAELTAGPGGTALRLGPLGGAIHGAIEECRFAGNCPLEVGRGGLLQVANSRFANGAVTLGALAVQSLALATVRFDGCTIATSGQAPVTAQSCCVVGGSVQGSAAAPLEFSSSFLSTAIGSNVTHTAALPNEHLGNVVLQPREPVLGGNLTLQADLPAGLFAIFVLGLTLETPALLSPELHIYLDFQDPVIPPGAYQLQQGVSLPIPNDSALANTDWVFQAAVLPAPGVTAPALQVPPGFRFVIR